LESTTYKIIFYFTLKSVAY